MVEFLGGMAEGVIDPDLKTVTQLLHSRWPEVRVAAVETLTKIGAGHTALRTAAKLEKNDVVLAAVCEGLLELDDKPSVPALMKLARQHSSSLVRRHATWAISEILKKGAVPMLRRLQRDENSQRVRATIAAALVKNGEYAELPALLEMLKSRDYLVRTSLGNFFANNVRMKRGRALVARHLRQALAVEKSLAAADAITRALARIAPDPPGMSQ